MKYKLKYLENKTENFMKNLLIGLALLASMSVFAQSLEFKKNLNVAAVSCTKAEELLSDNLDKIKSELLERGETLVRIVRNECEQDGLQAMKTSKLEIGLSIQTNSMTLFDGFTQSSKYIDADIYTIKH